MRENNSGNIPFYTALAVIFIFTILGLTYLMQNSSEYDDRGTFGDMFGFANAMFTGLSVIGLLVTILLQRKDLNIQREELKKQTSSIYIQNFENTFFQMINIFHKVIEDIVLINGTNKITGKAAINSIHSELQISAQEYVSRKEKSIYVDYSRTHFDITGDEIRKLIKNRFEINKNQLSHYFRTFFTIVEMIDANPVINKRIYINILTSQLTRTEIMMLLYFGVNTQNEKYRMLIEKYSLLKDIDKEKMIFSSMMGSFSNSAYNEM
ncbi:hypothetical protein C1631_001620 [Chryseobacterium phosphatilyticum]|uniref:Phage abortive infection protein n=1 Tax=Chryseobacterium phosphatilyticum TaxID=475075 RepID=A0A316XCC2_9FLAO|nr:putative phage abortive infection protein [Chryseobacterium phosphatilyticum]PWN71347.1 hypothetical protein C1631_001620 [Chryseobacterium phosphatilyticum]